MLLTNTADAGAHEKSALCFRDLAIRAAARARDVGAVSSAMDEMDHVPLPQRPPRRKRPRPQAPGAADANAAEAGAGPRDGASAAAASVAPPSASSTPPPPAWMPDALIVDGLAPNPRYEYRDHTADIQIHAWGETVEECFAWAAVGMFNYMTPLARLETSAAEAPEDTSGGRVPGNRNIPGDVTEDAARSGASASPSRAGRSGASASVGVAFEVEAHDAHSLLFAFLDELLFRFHTSMTVCRSIQVGPIDRTNWRVKCVGRGERFVDGVHEQGTEIKAITYSAMQIVERNARPGASEPADDGKEAGPENGGARGEAAGFDAELFVIVDI